MQSDRGGGGDPGRGAGAGNEPPRDETKPTEPVAQPDDPFGGGNVAPKNGPQSNLSLRKIQDMLKDEDTAKLLEDRGWSREQIEQFTKAFEKPKAGPSAGPGRKIDVEAGKDGPPAGPSANLPGFEGSRRINTKTLHARGSGAQDNLSGMHEGQRSEPPAEFRALLKGYSSRIARSPVTAKRPAPPNP